MPLVSFGGYTFPVTQSDFNANFGNAVPTTVRLPGKDGGWSMDGGIAPPTEIGTVSVSFTLISDTRAGMDDLIDALMAIVDYGLAKLIYQPTDDTDDVRFCYGYTNYAYISRKPAEHTDLWQDVRVIFQVPDPRWYSGNYGGVRVGDDGLTVDNPSEWLIGAGGYAADAEGTETLVTLPYGGNATTIVGIVINVPGGESAENITIERYSGGLVLDRVAYDGTLSAGSVLVLDGWKQIVTVDDVSAWQNVDYLHPDLMRVDPRTKTLRILMENVSDAAEVTFYFYDAFR